MLLSDLQNIVLHTHLFIIFFRRSSKGPELVQQPTVNRMFNFPFRFSPTMLLNSFVLSRDERRRSFFALGQSIERTVDFCNNTSAREMKLKLLFYSVRLVSVFLWVFIFISNWIKMLLHTGLPKAPLHRSHHIFIVFALNIYDWIMHETMNLICF